MVSGRKSACKALISCKLRQVKCIRIFWAILWNTGWSTHTFSHKLTQQVSMPCIVSWNTFLGVQSTINQAGALSLAMTNQPTNQWAINQPIAGFWTLLSMSRHPIPRQATNWITEKPVAVCASGSLQPFGRQRLKMQHQVSCRKIVG